MALNEEHIRNMAAEPLHDLPMEHPGDIDKIINELARIDDILTKNIAVLERSIGTRDITITIMVDPLLPAKLRDRIDSFCEYIASPESYVENPDEYLAYKIIIQKVLKERIDAVRRLRDNGQAAIQQKIKAQKEREKEIAKNLEKLDVVKNRDRIPEPGSKAASSPLDEYILLAKFFLSMAKEGMLNPDNTIPMRCFYAFSLFVVGLFGVALGAGVYIGIPIFCLWLGSLMMKSAGLAVGLAGPQLLIAGLLTTAVYFTLNMVHDLCKRVYMGRDYYIKNHTSKLSSYFGYYCKAIAAVVIAVTILGVAAGPQLIAVAFSMSVGIAVGYPIAMVASAVAVVGLTIAAAVVIGLALLVAFACELSPEEGTSPEQHPSEHLIFSRETQIDATPQLSMRWNPSRVDHPDTEEGNLQILNDYMRRQRHSNRTEIIVVPLSVLEPNRPNQNLF